jgi:hypothetical protein
VVEKSVEVNVEIHSADQSSVYIHSKKNIEKRKKSMKFR